jgi:hypothetical protein
MLTINIVTGLAMMMLTIIIHSVFMVVGARIAKWRRSHFGEVRKEMVKALLLSFLTIWLFLAIVIEAGLWAMLYLLNPLITALPDLETAFYFSMVTFTTLGFGDVVLIGQWRTLASIKAANGVIIFGWTTALIFYFIQHVYKEE